MISRFSVNDFDKKIPNWFAQYYIIVWFSLFCVRSFILISDSTVFERLFSLTKIGHEKGLNIEEKSIIIKASDKGISFYVITEKLDHYVDTIRRFRKEETI